MGQLETAARKRRKRDNIQRTVLSVIGAAGVISLTMIAPNVFQALPHIMGKDRYRLKFQAQNAVDRLLIKGLVHRTNRGKLEVTEKGWRLLSIEQATDTLPARAKRRWDGQYRLVMFDIPQKRRRTRDRLRELMQAFGFLRLQDSVWISPYDCEDLVALVKTDLRIGKEVLYAVVRELENDGPIRKHFGLR